MTNHPHSIQFARIGPVAIVYQTEHMTDEQIRHLVARDVATYGEVDPDALITRFNQCLKCDVWTVNGDRLRTTIDCPAVLKGLEYERAQAGDTSDQGDELRGGVGDGPGRGESHDGGQGEDPGGTDLAEKERLRLLQTGGEQIQAPMKERPTIDVNGVVTFSMMQGSSVGHIVLQIADMNLRFPGHRFYGAQQDANDITLFFVPRDMQ